MFPQTHLCRTRWHVSRLLRGLACAGTVGTMCISLSLTGCATDSQQIADSRDAEPDAPRFVDEELDPALMTAEALARRLETEINLRQTQQAEREAATFESLQEQRMPPAASQADVGEDVVWIDQRRATAGEPRTDHTRSSAHAAPVEALDDDAHASDGEMTEATAMPVGPVVVSTDHLSDDDEHQAQVTASPSVVVLSPRERAADLVDAIMASDATAHAKAVQLAALSVVVADMEVDKALLDEMDRGQRIQLTRFRDFITHWADAIAAGTAPIPANWLMTAVEQLMEDEPISIRLAQLCQRVDGYGVFTPFDDHTFLAGRANPMIVYIELDHFRAVELSDERYEVKLSQVIEVYNEADGLRVWGSSPVQVVDRSRNQRRDFFVVQLIELPARMTVGKYLMKVRITDQHGGSVSETSLPLNFVADLSMVSRTNR